MSWLTEHVYALTFVAALVDATALPFPGRLLLIVTGAVAAQGETNVALVIALAAVGALVGDHLWYAIGPLRLGYLASAPAVRAINHSRWLMAAGMTLGVVFLATPAIYRWRKRSRLARPGTRA